MRFTTPFHVGFETSRFGQLERFPPRGEVCRARGPPCVGGEGGDGGGNVRIELAAYSWVKNVESEFQSGAAFASFISFCCVVRDSYLHDSKDPNPGGDGYGFDQLGVGRQPDREQHFLELQQGHPDAGLGGGNVIGYNYFEDGYGEGYRRSPSRPERFPHDDAALRALRGE